MLFNNLFNTPDDQRFAMPTRLFHGRESRNRLFEMVPSGTPTALIVDRFFLDHPFIQRARKEFRVSTPCVMQGEPDAEVIQGFLDTLQDQSWSTLVAVGGGSTIDAAKAILAQRLFGNFLRVGYGSLREIPDLLPGQTLLPFVALPTTAGTGSEMSRYFLVSDPHTHEKLVSRSWSLCPSVAILDPEFLKESPSALLVQSAFDAFSHLWETLLCRQEASPIVHALAIEGITRLMAALERIDAHGRLDEASRSDLQLAAAWGGVALSNVRTGILHDAGETLVTQVPLPHPLSLYVFFQASLELFAGSIEERLRPLKASLSCLPSFGQTSDIVQEVGRYWSGLFEKQGLDCQLRRALSGLAIQAEPIVTKILGDQVLTQKESPRILDQSVIEHFVNKALGDWRA